MSAPLEWVKLYTKVITSADWRARPMFDRGIFYSLIAAAGLNGGDGSVHGKDTEIADLLGVSWQAARGALHRLSTGADAPLEVSSGGAVVRNWPKYQPNATQEKRRVDKRRGEKKISLETLPEGREWWDELAKKYPTVDLLAELQKAGEWHGADKVKSPKLYFRNWVERAAKNAPEMVVAVDGWIG